VVRYILPLPFSAGLGGTGQSARHRKPELGTAAMRKKKHNHLHGIWQLDQSIF
jgi:hypothetical protein